MLTKWRWKFLQIARQLWVRAALIGALGIVTAVLAAFGEAFVPWHLPGNIGADAVNDILNIIASSMLAVTTFSLSVMTSAFGAATTNVTPRATKLLIQDQTTQNVLATFIGSFLFALVGIIMLKTGIYGERGRAILFIATIAVVALIVVTLLRWIDHLSQLGRVSETTDKVERVTLQSIDARLSQPSLGGQKFHPRETPPQGTLPILSDTTGYVQHIDLKGLSDCAEALDADFYLGVVPGDFVHPARPLLWITRSEEAEDAIKTIRDCFDVGAERSFDQDPRFGVAVLSEIAIRALSPAVNDPGTAIDVIGRLTRLLFKWADGCDPKAGEGKEISFPRLHVPPIETADLFDDAFNLIARDGAAMIEVQLRLQKAMHALSQAGDDEFRACAKAQSKLAYERAMEAMPAVQDKQRLTAALKQQGSA